MFDADTLLDETINEAMDTELQPIPDGEYEAFVSNVEAKSITAKDGKIYYQLTLKWKIDDQELEDELGRELIVRQQIFLDLTDEGGLDFSKGKNVQLGKLRDALGQNTPGEPWAPSHLSGSQGYVLVITDANGFNQVKSVAGEATPEE